MGNQKPGSLDTTALKLELLQQLAEQTKRGSINGMQQKSGMLASVLVVGLVQLWMGTSSLSIGLPCAQHLHWWLACDGAATSFAMLLGLAASIKGARVAHGVEAHEWLRADGQERDCKGDLTGVWRLARLGSDFMDAVLVVSFLWGCYCLSTGGNGDACDASITTATASSWVRLGLVLKILAPMGVTVAVKGWHVLWGPPSTIPPQALSHQQRKRE
jgi:hypothetical protein